jgi:hypothetical protein
MYIIKNICKSQITVKDGVDAITLNPDQMIGVSENFLSKFGQALKPYTLENMLSVSIMESNPVETKEEAKEPTKEPEAIPADDNKSKPKSKKKEDIVE